MENKKEKKLVVAYVEKEAKIKLKTRLAMQNISISKWIEGQINLFLQSFEANGSQNTP